MKAYWICLGFVFLLASCQNPRKKLEADIKKQETAIDQGFTKEKADQLITSYSSFIDKYPEDEATRDYLLNCVDMSILNNDPNKALQFITQFQQKYPNDPEAPLVQFQKGVIYEMMLQDPLRAVAEYDILIKKYPNDSLAEDARFAILLIQDPNAYMNTVIKDRDSSEVQAGPEH